MLRLRNVLLVCISALLCSCSKSPISNGATTSYRDTIDPRFRVVMAYDNVDVVLRHADWSHVAGSYQIVTGDQLISNIKVENPVHKINGKDSIFYDTITIHNYNTLNWLRPYDYELKVTLFYDSISEIVFNSNGTVETDALKGTYVPGGHEDEYTGALRRVKLRIEGGSGDLKVKTDCFQLDTDYNFGTARVFLEGRSPITTTHCSYNSHGPIEARSLWTNFHYIFHYGTNYVNVFARHSVNANNYNNGVIQYVYDPEQHIPEELYTVGSNIIPVQP